MAKAVIDNNRLHAKITADCGVLAPVFTDVRQQYVNLADEELLRLASDPTSLTDEAKAMLEAEMRNRNLTSDDLSKYRLRSIRYERHEHTKRLRKIFGRRRDRDASVDAAVGLFWSMLIVGSIWFVYAALPAQYHLPPDWAEAAVYVMIASVGIVVMCGSWRRRLAFWVALVISSLAHAFILHTWIAHEGTVSQSRIYWDLALLLGLVLFTAVWACWFLLRRAVFGEQADSDKT